MTDDDDNMPVIYSYTSEQAIEDGVLVYPDPVRLPHLYITAAVHQCIEDCERDSNGSRSYESILAPLLQDVCMAIKAKMDSGKKWPNGDPIVLEGTVANTIWILPNENGGVTVMQPSDY